MASSSARVWSSCQAPALASGCCETGAKGRRAVPSGTLWVTEKNERSPRVPSAYSIMSIGAICDQSGSPGYALRKRETLVRNHGHSENNRESNYAYDGSWSMTASNDPVGVIRHVYRRTRDLLLNSISKKECRENAFSYPQTPFLDLFSDSRDHFCRHHLTRVVPRRKSLPASLAMVPDERPRVGPGAVPAQFRETVDCTQPRMRAISLRYPAEEALDFFPRKVLDCFLISALARRHSALFLRTAGDSNAFPQTRADRWLAQRPIVSGAR